MIGIGAMVARLLTGFSGISLKGVVDWFLGPTGRIVGMMLLAAAALGWAHHKGALKERAKCGAAAIQARLDIALADLENARRAALRGEIEQDRLQKAEAQNEKLKQEIEASKAMPSCALDSGSVKRLQRIR